MACKYNDCEMSTDFEEVTCTSDDTGSDDTLTTENEHIKPVKIEKDQPEFLLDFDDDCEGSIKFSRKPNHVLLIYHNFQVGLCTDMEVVFKDGTFKCHRWVIDAFMGIENLSSHSTSKEKFLTEYFCFLKSPELPMLIRAYYRNSDTQDFAIYIGHEQFKCHYDVLRCYTDFFDGQKRYGSMKLPKTEISIRAFFMIYRGCMLDQIPDLPMRGIKEVYKAAKYLRIHFLVKAIVSAIEAYQKQKHSEESIKYECPKLLNNFLIEKFRREI